MVVAEKSLIADGFSFLLYSLAFFFLYQVWTVVLSLDV
jgi:hypothetical protein